MGLFDFIGTVFSAGASATYDMTGGRKIMYDLLKDESDEDVMEFYFIHKDDDGDHDTYRAAKCILEMRGFTYNDKEEKWTKTEKN